MLRKVLSFVLLMSLAFAGVSCSNSDDSSEGGNGGNYAGWWYYNAGYGDGNRMLVLLSEDGSVLRAGTPDLTSYEDGVELSGDEFEAAKTKYSYKNESARAYLKKFADSGLSKLSYWCTVDSTQPFTWGIECIKDILEQDKNSQSIKSYEIVEKPDGSYNISVKVPAGRGWSLFLEVDDTLRGYRGSYPTVKPKIWYISTSIMMENRPEVCYIEFHNDNKRELEYPSSWTSTYNLDRFYSGTIRGSKFYILCFDKEKVWTGGIVEVLLTFSHPKAERELKVFLEVEFDPVQLN